MTQYWWLLLIVIAGGIYWFIRYRRTEIGREKVDAASLKVPIFGNVIRMLAVARFSRTLATLLASGVPLLVAFDIV
jgi:type II secretory pathway component PulF